MERRQKAAAFDAELKFLFFVDSLSWLQVIVIELSGGGALSHVVRWFYYTQHHSSIAVSELPLATRPEEGFWAMGHRVSGLI